MIKNDKQLAITKAKRGEFVNELEQLQKKESTLLNNILINQAKAQIEVFDDDITEYQWLKQEKPSIITTSISQIPEILIKARIIKGFSQEEFGNLLGLQAQQVQRYEANGYESASFERLMIFAKLIGIQFEETRIRLEETHIPLENYDDNFIIEATRKLKSRKGLLSI